MTTLFPLVLLCFLSLNVCAMNTKTPYLDASKQPQNILKDITTIKQQKNLTCEDYHQRLSSLYALMCTKKPEVKEYKTQFVFHEQELIKALKEKRKAFLQEQSAIVQKIDTLLAIGTPEGEDSPGYIKSRDEYLAMIPQYQTFYSNPYNDLVQKETYAQVLTKLENLSLRSACIEKIRELSLHSGDKNTLSMQYKAFACLMDDTDTKKVDYQARATQLDNEQAQINKAYKKQQYIATLESELCEAQQKKYDNEFKRLDTLATLTQRLADAKQDAELQKRSRQLRYQSAQHAPNAQIKNSILQALASLK